MLCRTTTASESQVTLQTQLIKMRSGSVVGESSSALSVGSSSVRADAVTSPAGGPPAVAAGWERRGGAPASEAADLATPAKAKRSLGKSVSHVDESVEPDMLSARIGAGSLLSARGVGGG